MTFFSAFVGGRGSLPSLDKLAQCHCHDERCCIARITLLVRTVVCFWGPGDHEPRLKPWDEWRAWRRGRGRSTAHQRRSKRIVKQRGSGGDWGGDSEVW